MSRHVRLGAAPSEDDLIGGCVEERGRLFAGAVDEVPGRTTRQRPVRLVIRPSGTEPKTKIYIEVRSSRQLGGTLNDASARRLFG